MKTCTAPGCVNFVFSHLYCQRHQYLRTDYKKPQRTVKRQAEGRTITTPDFGFSDQTAMFGWLWENSKDEHGYVVCKYTGNRLNMYLAGMLYWNCFAHILSKKQYPWFKLNPDNIEVVEPEFHRIVDQGSTKDRAQHPEWKWDMWDAKVIAMKEEYRQYKIKNLLR